MSQVPLNKTILVVDDEGDFARGLARLIQKGFPRNPVVVKHSGSAALDLIRENGCALMITDLRMPEMDGLSLLTRAIEIDPSMAVVLLTGFGTVETAVRALKNGAYDFLTKPIDQDVLFRMVKKALERVALVRENQRLRETVAGCSTGQVIIGDSPAIRQLNKEIKAVATTDYTVIIRGESGTGKELVARAIHRLSKRGGKPLVSVNCTAVPEHILESELFGHVKGAFTGAINARSGLFMEADGSSLHLDEIGDMPVHLQPKLLRTLQEGEIRPVGGSENIRADVRILASSHQPLESLITSGNFREDLYYRLNVLSVRVPSLRERPGDIPLLATHFLLETCREMGVEEKQFSSDTLGYLSSQSWPGNVRELLNFVRRLSVFCPGPLISENQARLTSSFGRTSTHDLMDIETYKDARSRFLEDFSRSYIQRLLEKTGGNISQSARLSGLERVSLQKILKRLGMDAAQYRKDFQ